MKFFCKNFLLGRPVRILHHAQYVQKLCKNVINFYTYEYWLSELLEIIPPKRAPASRRTQPLLAGMCGAHTRLRCRCGVALLKNI